eukprot:6829058-Prymnesium_polylepis.1
MRHGSARHHPAAVVVEEAVAAVAVGTGARRVVRVEPTRRPAARRPAARRPAARRPAHRWLWAARRSLCRLRSSTFSAR